MAVERVVLIWNPVLETPGTGYLVRPRLVLTARHVIFGKDEDDDLARELDLQTREQAQLGVTWSPATCCWSTREHDLALLTLKNKAELGDRAPAGPAYFRRLPTGQTFVEVLAEGFPQFRAVGFPNPIGQGALRHSLLAEAKVRDAGQAGDFRLDLEITSFGPNENLREQALKEGLSWWGGMSGAALLYGDRIAGVVVVDRSQGHDRSVLQVVPIRLVLDDDRFGKLVGLEKRDDRDKRQAKLEAELTKVLRGSDRAIGAILQRFAGNADLGLAEKPAALAQHLLQLELPVLLMALRDAFDDLEPDKANEEARKTISAAAQMLVPFLHDGPVTEAIRRDRLNPEVPIFKVPCATPMVAEVFMAAIDGRPTKYNARSSKNDYADGELLIAPPPETGIERGKEKVQAIREGILGKFAPGTRSFWRADVDDAVFRKVAPRRSRDELKTEDARRLAAAHLEVFSRNETYYMVHRPSKLEDDNQGEFTAGLREIKVDYPALMMLELSGDILVELADIKLFGHLNVMLPLKG